MKMPKYWVGRRAVIASLVLSVPGDKGAAEETAGGTVSPAALHLECGMSWAAASAGLKAAGAKDVTDAC
jgi:hypothetical protein